MEISLFLPKFLCFFPSSSLKASALPSVLIDEEEGGLLTLLENIQGSLQGAEKHKNSIKRIRKYCQMQAWALVVTAGHFSTGKEVPHSRPAKSAWSRFIYPLYTSSSFLTSEYNAVHLV